MEILNKLNNLDSITPGSIAQPIRIYKSTTGVVGQDSPKYSARWCANAEDYDEPYDGMVIGIIAPTGGHPQYGVSLRLNSLKGFRPIVYNKSTSIVDRYEAGSLLILVYNASQNATLYNGQENGTTVVGCWQVMDYGGSGSSGGGTQVTLKKWTAQDFTE